MKPRARSLRHKLTVWYLVVFSAIQLTLVFALVLFKWDTLRDAADGSIEASARVLIENMGVDGRPNDAWDDEYIDSMVPTDSKFVLFAVREADGSVTARGGVLAEELLPFTEEETVPTGPRGGVFMTVGREEARTLAGIDSPVRLLTMPFRSHGEEFFLQVGVRDDPLFLGPLTDTLLMGIPIALLAALVTSWLIAGRAVAPIQLLSDAARSVSPTSLGERISVETTDHEISKLQSELNSALARLEAGYRAQEQFISNVSHELKTPLAVLLTETQILHLGQETLERYRGWAERVEDEMKRLAQLVESFLTLTRCDLASGLVRKDEVAVHDLVLDSIQHSSALAERRGVHVVPELASAATDGPHGDGPTVKGDGDLLCTMLDNLLRNAIRFSPEGASVDVRVTMDEDDVCITVRDRGPGIPEEFIEKVFERFFQVPSDVGRQGSGIGLAIAHNVALLHDGKIAVTNVDGGGCAFVVVLPLSAVGGLESVPVA